MQNAWHLTPYIVQVHNVCELKQLKPASHVPRMRKHVDSYASLNSYEREYMVTFSMQEFL